jgi:hypothetical protein
MPLSEWVAIRSESPERIWCLMVKPSYLGHDLCRNLWAERLHLVLMVTGDGPRYLCLLTPARRALSFSHQSCTIVVQIDANRMSSSRNVTRQSFQWPRNWFGELTCWWLQLIFVVGVVAAVRLDWWSGDAIPIGQTSPAAHCNLGSLSANIS